jgi:hypothetical protein
MGKIGDLFVRLGLKSDDYKKGMADAKKETNSFSQGLGKMKAGALAVWGAIGTAVVSFARDFVKSTNKVGDAWEQTMGGIRQSWQTLKASLTNWDWKDFGSRMKDAFQGGKEGVAAADEVYEITNKMNIARAKMQNTLNELYFAMTDPSKELDERIAAGKKYLSMQKGLYDEEIALMKRQKDAAVKVWLSGTGVSASTADVEAFFSGYTGSANDAVAQQFPELRNIYENMRSDATNQPIVDAILAYQNALNRYNEENKRIIRQLNTLGAQEANERIDLNELLWQFDQDTYEAVDALKDVEIKTPPIDTSSLDRAEQELKDFTNAWSEEQAKIAQLNTMLSDSIVQATTAGMQAFADMLFGLEGADASAILGALMQPFADTAGQLGGMLLAQGIAVEAFKTSLDSLQGAPAIAAGLSLIAISAAMKSGIKALAKGGGNAGSTASYGGSSYSGGAAQNYESTLTVNVVGTISGSDIALSLDRTRKNQKR